jgi:hypothetical protein
MSSKPPRLERIVVLRGRRRALVVLQRGELEQRLLDELVDDRGLVRLLLLAVRDRAAHELRDVEGAHRPPEAIEEGGEIPPQIARRSVAIRRVAREGSREDATRAPEAPGVERAQRGDLRGLHELHRGEVRLAEEEAPARRAAPRG